MTKHQAALALALTALFASIGYATNGFFGAGLVLAGAWAVGYIHALIIERPEERVRRARYRYSGSASDGDWGGWDGGDCDGGGD